MNDSDLLREEHFKRREMRATYIYQTYLETHRAIWIAQHAAASEVLFGNADKEKELEKEVETLKEQFFIKTKKEFDEVDKALS